MLLCLCLLAGCKQADEIAQEVLRKADDVGRSVFPGGHSAAETIAAATAPPQDWLMGAPAAAGILNFLPASMSEAHVVFKSADDIERVSAVDASAILSRFGYSAGTSLEDALSSSNGVLVIVGHNEDNAIITPAGRHLQLVEAAHRCVEAKKRCIFLSCNSESVASHGAIGVGYSISASRAATLASRIIGLMETNASMGKLRDPASVNRDLHNMLNDHGYRIMSYYGPKAGFGSLGLGGGGLLVVGARNALQT